MLLIRPTEGCRSGERPQTLVTSLSNLTSLVHAEQNNQLPNPSNVSGITNKIQIVTSAKELSFTLFVCERITQKTIFTMGVDPGVCGILTP